MPKPLSGRESISDPLQLTFREPTSLDAETLAMIRERGAEIQVVLNNEVRFAGTDSDLAALAFDHDGLAGEHPLEHMIRVLTLGDVEAV